jgi:hypothetical protein
MSDSISTQITIPNRLSMTGSKGADTSSLPNPEESANFFSKCVFWWIQGILKKGYEAPLQESDVFACHYEFQSETLNNRVSHNWDKESKKQSPSLAKALLKTNARVVIIIVLQCIVQSFFLVAPTVLVSKVSSYFDKASEITRQEALIYGGTLCALNVSYIGLQSFLFWNLHLLGPVIRIQVSTLIYNKVKFQFIILFAP